MAYNNNSKTIASYIQEKNKKENAAAVKPVGKTASPQKTTQTKIRIKKKKEFSKVLLIQESALIWILSFGFLVLAFFCVIKDYVGSLPWITAMVGLPWAAYGVSQGFYYNKSKIENSRGGIKYASMVAETGLPAIAVDAAASAAKQNKETQQQVINDIINLDYGF